MANIFTRIRVSVNNFIEARPLLQKTINFLKHPTVWRIVAVAFAAGVTIASGGAAMPAIGLGLIFGSSLISIIAKVVQLRRVNNLKLQKAIIEGIQKARGSETPRKLEVVHEIKVPEGEPSKRRAMLKAIRDVGLENIAPIIAAGLTFDAPGLFGYISALTWGITRVAGYSGLAGYGVASEFSERVQADLAKAELKKAINLLCREAQIPPFDSIDELYRYAIKELKLNPALEKQFRDVIENQPSWFKSIISAINPFGEPYQHQNFDGLPGKIESFAKRAEHKKSEEPKPHIGRSPLRQPILPKTRGLPSPGMRM